MKIQVHFSVVVASIVSLSLFSCAKDDSGTSSQSWLQENENKGEQVQKEATEKQPKPEEWIPLATFPQREFSSLFKKGKLYGPTCKSVLNGVERIGVLWHHCSADGIWYINCARVAKEDVEIREKDICNSDMAYDGNPYVPDQPEKIFFLRE